MFCSVIIPTIGRESVRRAVTSVLDQSFSAAEVEVIVVNDSGRDLQPADWLQDRHVQVVHTQRRERNFARNTGAAVAKGDYLWFLDDDDWMLPGALEAMWNLSLRFPDAAWLYGGIRIVDHDERLIAEINSGFTGNVFAQIMGGGWAPIQTSMVRSEPFFHLGGFNPSIIGTEDLDLCRRFASQGEFANTPFAVAVLQRGESWTTSTDYSRAEQDTKRSRNRVLSEEGSFSRLVRSAGSAYWFGRILKVYLSTMILNLRENQWLTVISRMLYAFGVLVLAFKYLFTQQFWAGVRADHVPDTLHFVMEAYEHAHTGERAQDVVTD